MIYSYGVSQQGSYHINNNIVCQDSHKINIISDRFAIGAVADGLGSELYTDIASKLAVDVSVSYCKNHINYNDPEEKILDVIKASFNEALMTINTTAEKNGHETDQYDTTLALAVYINGNLFYGNSGDSGIIVMNSDGTFESVTIQQRDENNCVFPLCFGEDKWVLGSKKNIASVMLATDGMYEPFFPYLLKGEKVEIYTALALYMMSESSLGFQKSSDKSVQEKMNEFITNIPSEQVSDDKTVLVMVDTDIDVKLQPEEYYASPDWKSLKKKRDDEYKKAAYPHLYKNKENIVE